VRFACIRTEKAFFPVAFMCRQLAVSRSGFYAWCERPEAARTRVDAKLVIEIRSVHDGSRGTYGSPRVHAELRARGRLVGRGRVERLMRVNGIEARRKRRFCRTTDSRHPFPIAENLLARQFEVAGTNEAWVTDITYIPTGEGWLYLAAILDLYSRRVVGWAMSDRITRQLALDALAMAVRVRRPGAGLLHHSDRGSQYASDDYRSALKGRGIVCSMSRKGDCWDNAVAESFFGTLKTELVDRIVYPTRAIAEASVDEYIDVFYNHQRRHSHNDYKSPVEYELKTQIAALAA
jgi:putative transposase